MNEALSVQHCWIKLLAAIDVVVVVVDVVVVVVVASYMQYADCSCCSGFRTFVVRTHSPVPVSSLQ